MSRNLTVDDDVFEALQDLAEPLVDDANSVLRRLLGLDRDTAQAPGDAASPKPVVSLADVPSAAPATSRSARKGKGKAAGSKHKNKKPRAARGSILPESAYELPILHALDERGGSAPATEVIERVGELLRDELRPGDADKISSGLVRWKNRTQFVRLNLVKAGDMVKDSPRGVWQITEQGRRRITGAA